VDVLSSRTYIVLATFNGGQFLAEQFDSLLSQSITDWSLLVRDDLSSDDTLVIIEKYASRDGRIEILTPPTERLASSARNFAGLLQEAYQRGADYLFCCDQDDVWDPDKLARVLHELQRIEGPDRVPCLVHHDLVVVDEQLGPVADSYWLLMALQPADESNPQRLLSRNEVTGCAMACNRALLGLALPLSPSAVMHDWWLALFAGFYGTLLPLRQRLVSYRQHSSNVIGAKSYRAGLNPLQNWVATWRRGNEEFLDTVRQARAFRDKIRGKPELDPALRAALDAYCELPRVGRLQRIAILRRCGVWRRNWLLDTVLVLRVLLLAVESD
jgi:glycosyltransferase involved in cell wall biosynthesis